ncbi:MAG: (2Fe-2S)-binding protein [Holophagaceae bacterium]|nr:(2Fe-2S)-binding protein [Holophagaceae bacterium]
MKVTLVDQTESVELEAGLPLVAGTSIPSSQDKHSCRGHGRCGRCLVEIVAGIENLSLPSEAESRILRILRANPKQRLACQAMISGDVVYRL